MDASKVKGGQLVAAVGGIILLVGLLFLKWYGFGGSVETPFGGAVKFSAADIGAWDGAGFLGTIANLVILVAGIAAVGLAILTATARSVALPVAASALTAGLGIASVAMVVLRIFFRPGSESDLKFGIFVGLVGAVVVAVGGWQSMKEEGTSFDEAKGQLQDKYGGSGEGPGSGGSPGGESGAPPPPS